MAERGLCNSLDQVSPQGHLDQGLEAEKVLARQVLEVVLVHQQLEQLLLLRETLFRQPTHLKIEVRGWVRSASMF